MMNIRNAGFRDKTAIARLHAASISHLCRDHYEPEQLEAWINIIHPDIYDQALREKVFVVAEEGPDILGFGMLDGEKGEVSAVYIAPEFAGQGVGAAILGFLENAAAGRHHLTLTVFATLNAERFYIRHGFRLVKPTGHTLPDGTRLPCLEMTKDLTQKTPAD